jgi:CspA family cold shock protein
MIEATVKQWTDDEGWGVLSSPEVDGDIWAHFSALQADGFRTLTAGDTASVEVVDLGGPIQDGYRYRAERIIPSTSSLKDR